MIFFLPITILSSKDKCRIFNSYNYLSVYNYDNSEGEKGTGGSAQADLEELKKKKRKEKKEKKSCRNLGLNLRSIFNRWTITFDTTSTAV